MAKEWTAAEKRDQARRLREFYDTHPTAREEAKERALDYYSSERGKATIQQLKKSAAIRNEIIAIVSQALVDNKTTLDLNDLRNRVDQLVQK